MLYLNTCTALRRYSVGQEEVAVASAPMLSSNGDVIRQRRVSENKLAIYGNDPSACCGDGGACRRCDAALQKSKGAEREIV